MRLLPALALLALIPTAPLACARDDPFVLADLALAPLVLRVELTGYSTVALEGRLQVSVIEALRGTVPPKITLNWMVRLAELPPAIWDRPTRLILAATPPETGMLYDLVVPHCSQANILPDTPENLAAVRAILRDPP
jgi:hypothetical protein